MADDAGFAVAITIHERVMNDALMASYVSGSVPTLALNVPPDAPTDPPVFIDLFPGPPQIACKANNTLILTLDLWGPVTITFENTVQTAKIVGELTVQVEPSFTVQATTKNGNTTTNLVAEFDDPDDVTATAWDFTVFSGSFSPDADTYLRSDTFRHRMQDLVQQAFTSGLVALPKVPIDFLGPILQSVNNMTAKSRVVSGALMLGLDVNSNNVTTNGDADQLSDFAGSNDIAAVTNAVAVPLMVQPFYSQVSDQVAQQGATLNSLTMSAQDGQFHVEGAASNTEGSTTFSFDLIPTTYATKPGALFQYVPKTPHVNGRVWPALGLSTANVKVNVDVNPEVWLAIVLILPDGISLMVIPFVLLMASSIADQVKATIQSESFDVPAPRVQTLPPSVPGVAPVRIAITDYEVTSAGTYVALTVQPKPLPGMVIGPISIPSNLASATLSYSVRLPLGVLLNDPALHIRWMVLGPDGTVLLTQDTVAAGHGTFTFVPQTVGAGLSQLGVTCRVYRPLGAQVTDFLNDSVPLAIRGPLPAGAYVRWFYDVKNPQIAFDDKQQQWTYTGNLVVSRHSRLHRTDKPCANEAKRSRYQYRTVLYDALPYPVTDIAAHRTELCDYCFYGGPAGLRPSF